MIDRRSPWGMEEAKFATQKVVTYTLLIVFSCVVFIILYQNDQSERSMILQTVINLTLLSVGYWLGASDQGKKQQESIARIAEQSAPVSAAAVAAATGAAATQDPLKVDVVNLPENTKD